MHSPRNNSIFCLQNKCIDEIFSCLNNLAIREKYKGVSQHSPSRTDSFIFLNENNFATFSKTLNYEEGGFQPCSPLELRERSSRRPLLEFVMSPSRCPFCKSFADSGFRNKDEKFTPMHVIIVHKVRRNELRVLMRDHRRI